MPIPNQRDRRSIPRSPHLRPTTEYFDQIFRSDEFLRTKLGPHLSATAFRGAALGVAEIGESGYQNLDSLAMTLIANVGTFTEGQRSLDRLDGRARREQKEPHLEKVIRFNRALRAMIDSNPQLKRSEIIILVAKTQLRLTGAKDTEYAAQATRERLAAMTQELITESALWQLSTVETIIDPETEAQELLNELNGTDVHVLLTSGEELFLDVASSLRGERHKLSNRPPYAKSEPFWTGVDSCTFGENVRGSDADVQTAKNRLLDLFPQLREQ